MKTKVSKRKPKMDDTPAIQFINSKFKESSSTLHPAMKNFLFEGYTIIRAKLGDSKIDPTFTRKVEALEAVMFSFIEHVHDDDALDRLQKSLISDIPRGRLLQ